MPSLVSYVADDQATPAHHAQAVQSSADADGSLPLVVYCVSVLGIMSFYGGATATRPAQVMDLFGSKHVGIITARQMSVVMPASFLGPYIATHLRESSLHDAIRDLSMRIDDVSFTAAFGAGKEQLELLISQKTVTIARLLEMLPANTSDPTIYIYDNAIYAFVTLQCLAFVMNTMLKPVPKSLHLPEKPSPSSAPPKEEPKASKAD